MTCLQFEQYLEKICRSYEIHGYADLYNPESAELWEFKVVQQVEPIHFLQLVIYYWLSHNVVRQLYVYNLYDDLLYHVQVTPENATKIVNRLIEYKIHQCELIMIKLFWKCVDTSVMRLIHKKVEVGDKGDKVGVGGEAIAMSSLQM